MEDVQPDDTARRVDNTEDLVRPVVGATILAAKPLKAEQL